MTRRAPATPDEVARWLSIQGSTALGQGVIALLGTSDEGRAVLETAAEKERAHLRARHHTADPIPARLA